MTNWQAELPTLTGAGVTLRELQIQDAPSLFSHLDARDVSRLISPPPTSVREYEAFIEWAHLARRAGHYACFAVVSDRAAAATGICQLRKLNASFTIGELGIVLATRLWGAGVLPEAARLMLQFAFTAAGVQRLEARTALPDRRGRQPVQVILESDWRRQQRPAMAPGDHGHEARSVPARLL